MEGDKKYIELEAAKQAIMDYIAGHTVSKFPTSELCRASRMGAEGAMYELELVPAADVEEVKHGEWISARPSGGYDFYCSCCKEFAITYEDSNYREQYYLTDHCPNCGAKMDGK